MGKGSGQHASKALSELVSEVYGSYDSVLKELEVNVDVRTDREKRIDELRIKRSQAYGKFSQTRIGLHGPISQELKLIEEELNRLRNEQD